MFPQKSDVSGICPQTVLQILMCRINPGINQSHYRFFCNTGFIGFLPGVGSIQRRKCLRSITPVVRLSADGVDRSRRIQMRHIIRIGIVHRVVHTLTPDWFILCHRYHIRIVREKLYQLIAGILFRRYQRVYRSILSRYHVAEINRILDHIILDFR